MFFELHRNMLESQEGVSGQPQLVSITRAVSHRTYTYEV